jgi:hypothetical protein
MGSIAEGQAPPLMPVDPGDSPAATIPIDPEAFPPPRQAWYTVGVLAVITTFALLDQNILGLLIQQIKTDFRLSDSQAGLLLGPTQAMLTAADRLAADLAGNDWLAGNRFTFADIAVYPHVAQFGALGLALPKAVDEWLARVTERPSVQAIKSDLFPVATMGPELGRWG